VALFYYDDVFLDHDTGDHPECAERLRAIMVRLRRTDLLEQCESGNWQPVSDERIARVHDLGYVQSVGQFADAGGGRIEQDTVVSPQSYQAARRAAGAVCDAAVRVVRGEDKHALCLVRPPGHHALRGSAMGFCLLNNIAIAAQTAIAELGIDRALIVDWDVHHGNGTQDAFWDDEQVAFFSMHRWPFYPGTGAASETGTGRGLGSTLNLPVQFGTPRKDYLAQFAQELEDFSDRVKPQLVLISAGFDAHRQDPVGSLGLEIEDFGELTDIVLAVADAHADGKVVSVLEGGYNPGILARCVETHLRRLL
jgi:acetoin utilization deacetylase AcuC-like enzyme